MQQAVTKHMLFHHIIKRLFDAWIKILNITWFFIDNLIRVCRSRWTVRIIYEITPICFSHEAYFKKVSHLKIHTHTYTKSESGGYIFVSRFLLFSFLISTRYEFSRLLSSWENQKQQEPPFDTHARTLTHTTPLKPSVPIRNISQPEAPRELINISLSLKSAKGDVNQWLKKWWKNRTHSIFSMRRRIISNLKKLLQLMHQRKQVMQTQVVRRGSV